MANTQKMGIARRESFIFLIQYDEFSNATTTSEVRTRALYVFDDLRTRRRHLTSYMSNPWWWLILLPDIHHPAPDHCTQSKLGVMRDEEELAPVISLYFQTP